MAREMRHSGIEWIGEIPKEWKVLPLKWILRKPLQYGANESGYPFDESLPRYVRITDILNNNLREDLQKQSLTEEQANGYILENNDILFARSGGTVGKAFLYSSKYGRCAFAGYLIRAQINSQNDSCYIYYYTQSAAYDEWKKQIFIQATIQNIGADRYSLLEIPLPPLSEQQKIANYLDKVCGEVDEMIALQEQMIEELKAYKQSVITEAVTKGLNPDVPMKDSSVDWIGEVPEHWEVKKIGYIFYNLDYLREPISAELRERNNPQYDYFGASGVIDKIDHYNVEDKVLLIGEDGANLVMRNLPLIYKAEGRFWVNNHAHILKPIKDDYNYMAHTLEAADYRNYITGFAQPKLSQENLKAVKLPVPPLSEQQSIASYLDTKCAEIDALIAIKQAKIEELKDYKKSVIYEYVTGKKEVV